MTQLVNRNNAKSYSTHDQKYSLNARKTIKMLLWGSSNYDETISGISPTKTYILRVAYNKPLNEISVIKLNKQ